MKEKHETKLVDLEENQLAVVSSIDTCHKTKKRLADLGLTTNTSIKILRKAGACGPIEIKIRGSSLVLGKGIVSKILVKKI